MLQRLRATAALARFVLAWFALSLGVAMAAPLVQPHALQLICGGGTIKLLQDNGDAPASTLTMDCALCAPAIVPPPQPVTLALLAPAAPGPVLAPQAHGIDRLAVLQPPARGPPLLGAA